MSDVVGTGAPAPPPPPGPTGEAGETRRRTLRNEVLLVLGVSLGASAAYSTLGLLSRLTAPGRLADQQATLNASRAPERPWIDLAYQLLDIAVALVPVALALHLLARFAPPVRSGGLPGAPPGLPGAPPGRSGWLRAAAAIGVDTRRPWFDLGTGAGLALCIGVPGLGLYLAARALNLNVNVVPAALADVWWAVPVLVLAAAQNAVLEEVVVVGYLVTRLEQMRFGAAGAVAVSSVLRGVYHLYQGFGGFVGNVVMGVIFAGFFLRTRRTMPLVVAHTLIDVVAFVGYTLVRDHVSWI